VRNAIQFAIEKHVISKPMCYRRWNNTTHFLYLHLFSLFHVIKFIIWLWRGCYCHSTYHGQLKGYIPPKMAIIVRSLCSFSRCNGLCPFLHVSSVIHDTHILGLFSLVSLTYNYLVFKLWTTSLSYLTLGNVIHFLHMVFLLISACIVW
jgi:hypothetical protein